jgi:hypothetical protein
MSAVGWVEPWRTHHLPSRVLSFLMLAPLFIWFAGYDAEGVDGFCWGEGSLKMKGYRAD